MNAPFLMPAEIVVDSFAGGGGTSEGIRQAIGRDPDIAINHDKLALAMHRVNHPGTHHMVEDVWHVDAIGMCDGRPIGLLWLSPDCKDFSKAKGGKPVDKAIRGLAWVGFRWVKSLPKKQRPRIIILENVEEFQDWGPLLADNTRCPVQKGATFKQYIEAFSQVRYKAEWRELRACDYGDPTIRKRLFVILRRDGQPIVWPERTHGNPKDSADAALIAAGKLLPWRTAAEIIDFSLPCPSIFETSAEIKASLGLRANRPLAYNTMARVAKGTMRYVVDAVRPFIVPVTHQGDLRANSVDEPLRTITTAKRGEHALVTPFITKFNRGSTGHALDEPLATVTSHASETRGGGAAPLGLVAPLMVRTAHGEADKNGRRRGRGDHSCEDPMPTVLASNDSALAAVHLARHFGNSIGAAADDPAPTVTAGGDGKTALISAFLAQHNTDRGAGIKPGRGVEEPLSTIMATGGQATVVAAYMAQHNSGMVGHPLDKPVSTITQGGQGGISQQGLVAAHMITMRGSDRRDAGADAPLNTVSAGGNHAGLVAAFLAKYYGAGEPVQSVEDPLHTLTTKPRHGLVTVSFDGETYVITDIGMRMLTPRERFSAQGFRPTYTIDHGILDDGTMVRFTMEQQGKFCGNSVCPGMARALVSANYLPAERMVGVPPRAAPLFDYGVAAE